MADNSTLPVSSGTEVFANDDIAGVKYPRVKPTFGADGSATDVSSANPLPVADASVVTAITSGAAAPIPAGTNVIGAVTQSGGPWSVSGTFWQATQPISAASLPLPAGAATSAKQPALGTAGSASADVLSVQGIAGATPVTAGGVSAIASANFNRPADTTAYAIGDLVANSTTAGSVTPLSLAVARVNAGTGMIRRGRLTKSGTTATLASFRAHFFKTSPTAANGDNGVFSTNQALTYIGSMDFDMTGANGRAFTDGVTVVAVPNVGSEVVFQAGSGVTTIFALLEARAAYVPASAETFTLALEVLQD